MRFDDAAILSRASALPRDDVICAFDCSVMGRTCAGRRSGSTRSQRSSCTTRAAASSLTSITRARQRSSTIKPPRVAARHEHSMPNGGREAAARSGSLILLDLARDHSRRLILELQRAVSAAREFGGLQSAAPTRPHSDTLAGALCMRDERVLLQTEAIGPKRAGAPIVLAPCLLRPSQRAASPKFFKT